MEFSYSSDDEPTLAYDDYKYTPFTPSAVKPLWKEHFKRPVKYRNPEVKRAFEAWCSIHKFMYPDLDRAKIIAEVTKQLKATSNTSKRKFKLVFKGIVENDLCHKNKLIIPEANESQGKHPGEMSKKKNVTVIKSTTKSADQLKVKMSSFLDKFTDLKETNETLETDKTKMIKDLMKSEKESFQTQSKRQSSKKPKPRCSKSNIKLENNDGMLNNADITDEPSNSVTALICQADSILKIEHLSGMDVSNIHRERKDQIIPSNMEKFKKGKTISIKKKNKSSVGENPTVKEEKKNSEIINSENKNKPNNLKVKKTPVSVPKKLMPLKIVKTKLMRGQTKGNNSNSKQ